MFDHETFFRLRLYDLEFYALLTRSSLAKPRSSNKAKEKGRGGEDREKQHLDFPSPNAPTYSLAENSAHTYMACTPFLSSRNFSSTAGNLTALLEEKYLQERMWLEFFFSQAHFFQHCKTARIAFFFTISRTSYFSKPKGIVMLQD